MHAVKLEIQQFTDAPAGARQQQRVGGESHSILVICWHRLTTGETYNDLGGDHFDKRRNSPTRERHLIAQLEALGHKVTLEPAA